jgi:hypothetical protein
MLPVFLRAALQLPNALFKYRQLVHVNPKLCLVLTGDDIGVVFLDVALAWEGAYQPAMPTQILWLRPSIVAISILHVLRNKGVKFLTRCAICLFAQRGR